MTTRVFNPYSEAAGDVQAKYDATKPHWKRMCWSCGKEKPIAGGKFPGLAGASGRAGAGEQFRCADCDAKREARRAAVA